MLERKRVNRAKSSAKKNRLYASGTPVRCSSRATRDIQWVYSFTDVFILRLRSKMYFPRKILFYFILYYSSFSFILYSIHYIYYISNKIFFGEKVLEWGLNIYSHWISSRATTIVLVCRSHYEVQCNSTSTFKSTCDPGDRAYIAMIRIRLKAGFPTKCV